MQTGENEQGLREIMDLTRMSAITLLILHCYYYCYQAFAIWELTHPITDQLLSNIAKTGLFNHIMNSKWLSLALLMISLLGNRGRKKEKLNWKLAVGYVGVGLLLFYGSVILLNIHFSGTGTAMLYMGISGIGFILILSGGTQISRYIPQRLNTDIFNTLSETFPQEERFLENPYSINLPASYNLKGKTRQSWLNIINPFRGLLVIGNPGSGKSYFIIQEVIRQHISKGFSLFVYDFKYDDLTRIAWQSFHRYKSTYKKTPSFFSINFDDLSRTHRCNPLYPESMTDITDATESARTIMLALNREWIRRQGDFFVESPINFLTAIIWYLKKYKDGSFCTLPHVIELMQVEYDKLFTILRTEPEIEALINPFISAYENEVMEQLEGQIAAAKIAMARLASPQLYYILSGNDFLLDINNPNFPKIVCMGNNPQKQQIYGAVLSLYISRMIKLVNRKGGTPCGLIFDEFPTIYFNGMDNLIATARSNKIATTLSVQDYSQLKKDYGQDQAEVIMNIMGNVICGQVPGQSARDLSERFGKIKQDRDGITIGQSDTSINKSYQLDSAIPASTIATLSSGEFVGIVSDNPDQKIELKAFHARLYPPKSSKSNSLASHLPVIQDIDPGTVTASYFGIKADIQLLVGECMGLILNDPEMAVRIVGRKK